MFEEEIVKEPLKIEEIEEYEVDEYEEEGAPVTVRRNVKPARRPPPPRSGGWLW